MKKYTSQLGQVTRTIFPNISEKDIEAFSYSKPEKERYELSEDLKRKENVPAGTILKHHLANSKHYPGTERDYWVYLPKQYDASKPAALMVFQDGALYLFEMMQANIVLDNFIYKKEIPIIIGLFINPGDKGPGMPIYGGFNNRNIEYDSVDDVYAGFLLEEILSQIKKDYNIYDDPKERAIVGISSGAVCAFNVAWQNPDVFGKVICIAEVL